MFSNPLQDSNAYGLSEDDMIHYHSVFADSGNTGAQLILGVFYLHGMGGAERNFEVGFRSSVYSYTVGNFTLNNMHIGDY